MKKNTLRKNWFSIKRKQSLYLLSIPVFAAVGAAILLTTKAAVLSSTIEPEGGTLTGSVVAADDSNASGGKYVTFVACPAGQTGTPPNCVVSTGGCPAGQVGTPPRCISPTPTKGTIASIPSNFDVASWMVGTVGTNIPASAAPDTVGAFRFLCSPSHNSYDDPIVYPGKPGAAHLHTFFGNTTADAYSTYDSLRKAGNGTCSGGPINRSAYWAPAMLNGQGKVVMPDYTTIYYKAEPGTTRLPRGLRMIFGFDMNTETLPSGTMWWNCDGNGAPAGHFATITQANCPVGSMLGGILHTPDCWDGINLDSANHRSHLAYPYYNDNGQLVCPAGYPTHLPVFTIGIWYKVAVGDTLSQWYLSSDKMTSKPVTPGTTLHSDWFGAWDDGVMDIWMGNCINKLLNCSGGILGDGRQLKWPDTPIQHLVDVPAKP